MKGLHQKLLFASILLTLCSGAALAQCPTPALARIEVCNDASGNGTIRAYFFDGAPATSYVLFSLAPPAAVSAPFGPVTVNTAIPLPPGAVGGVEFGLVPNGDYIIRVNCFGGGFVFVGGFGINVNSANAVTLSATVDPDCIPATGPGNADGGITLSIAGGVAPYNITWPAGTTPILPSVAPVAGNYTFLNLDGGAYTAQVTDNNNCVTTLNIAVPLSTMPDAGADQVVCSSTATLNGNAPGAGETGTWTGPAGVTFTPSANTRNAVAGNLAVGVNTLTWTINDSGGLCVGNADQVDITRSVPPLVNAGADQTICAGATVTLNGSIGGSASTGTWTGGAGSFAPGNTTLNAVYTPTAAEIASGSVTLTLTTDDPDGAGPCVPVSDDVTITINALATVNAGADQTICADGSATLNGTIGGSASSATWSGGTGSFAPGNTTLNATYTPSAAEIAANTVTLTLTTNDPDGAGPCAAVSDNVTVTINPLATVNAGPDQTICAGASVLLNGTIGGAAASATWSGGAGSFAPGNTALNATYTPSAAEVAANTVTLTLTTNDPDGAGPCTQVSDNITITINAIPVVNAGADQTICGNGSATLNGTIGGSASTGTWSGGAGIFTPGNTTLNATYTPSAGEIAANTVTLTLTTDDPDGAGPCVAVSDMVTITINPAATASAGADQTICAGSTVTLNGVIGGAAASATWSGGTGSFIPNNTTVNATYTPSAAEVAAGTVTLTLSTNDPDGAGPCTPATDQVTITINALPTVSAGADQTICADGTVTLNGTLGGSATSATWSGGTGSFLPNNTTLNATYTPSGAEIAAGTVTLTLTTNDPDGAGPCAAASDGVTITINALATVNAGADQTICADGAATLNGAIGGSAVSATWSGGGGIFTPGNTTLNATYTPSAGEISAGTVTLTLTTNDPDGAGPCAAVSDQVTITINPVATVNAGADQTICAGASVTLNGAFGGSAVSAAWSGGTGVFTPDNLTLNAGYTPSAAEVAAGTVTLTLTTSGPCSAVSDNMTITINAQPTVDAGADQTVCAGSTVTLNGSMGGSSSVATWSGGAGVFTPGNTTLNAAYTPTAAEIAAGMVTLTLTSNDPDGGGPCVPASDDVVITINAAATVNAGSDQAMCADGAVTLNGTIGGSAGTAAWSGGLGSFSPDNTTLNAAYTPTAGEITAGTFTLTLTTNDPDGGGPCAAVSDNVTITINPAATVNAGPDMTICADGVASLNGVVGGSAVSGTWSGGAGVFLPANTTLNATYTPTAAEISAGTVTLTLTSNDPDGAGPCVPVSDNVVVTINALATVNAGSDQTVCEGVAANLNGAFAGSASAATWSGGAGVFTPDNTTLNATYMPSAAENAAGSVTLTLTTNDPDGAGPCVAASDNITITIQPAATANAGADQTICADGTVTLSGTTGGSATGGTWSGGTGIFSPGNTSLNAIYTPSAAEVAAGTVVLTLTTAGPCAAATDNVTITINALATVNAGTDVLICAGDPVTLNGSVGGGASSGTWSGGAGVFTPGNTTLNALYTPTAAEELAGAVTLTLTTNDPDGAGPCAAVSDDVVITISGGATADAGPPQTICSGETVTLAGSFTGTTGITWSSAGDGSFNNVSMPNAVYTPGTADIAGGSVTLTLTTAGPCAPVSDMVVITIAPASVVDAGMAQTICAGSLVFMNGTFGGSATGLVWSTGGDGTFDDANDPNARYTPGAGDIAAGSAVLTATAVSSCTPVSDNVTITIDPAAVVDAGPPQTVCAGLAIELDGTLSGAATTVTWSTSGDGTFNNPNDPDATYTPGTGDRAAGTVTLTATTNNPAGPCPAGSDNVVMTIVPVPGDQTTAGNETWLGYVYDDFGDPTAIPAKINFSTAKYRGFIDATDIGGMSAASTYDVASDAFDLNLGIPGSVQGPNVCGSYVNFFSVRYKMDKTFAEGIYRFTVGGDDGVRLLIDGVNVLPASAFDFQSYTEYTSAPVCLSAGVHALEIHYFDNTAQSRLTFAFTPVPAVSTISPVTACINTPAPALTVSSTDPDVLDFNWYKGASLVFTGASYTPDAAALDMTTAGTTNFAVTAVYACGETVPVAVAVNVVNAASLTINPETVCESGGLVDLRTLVAESPAGGSFVFSGHPNISGNNFDPAGLAGNTIPITVDYAIGSCTTQGTLNLTVSSTASVSGPAGATDVCETAPDIDLTTLVNAVPAGGAFVFSGPQVTGNLFDPSGLSGAQTITVDYSIGGCNAPQITFQVNVNANASVTTTNATVCANGAPVNLLTRVSGTPAGGTFTFAGTGVTGNSFNPAGQSGNIAVTVNYTANGCAATGTIQMTVLDASDPLCSGAGTGNCATVVITPKPQPATCTNSDGRVVMSIKPFVPAVNNTGVKITLSGISSTNMSISRTNFNDSIFNALPTGIYDYTIEYGDPSCIKTGQVTIDQSGTVGTPTASNIVSPSCYGTATGSLRLSVTGETGNVLEWSLDGGITDPFKPFTAGSQITGIPAGAAPTFEQVISVRRNASDPCFASVTVVIAESAQQITATFATSPATCNGNDGAITGIVPGGGSGSGYSFSLNGGQSFQTTNSFQGLAGGSYTLTVRDGAGCTRDFPVSITFPGFINFTISKSDADCTNGGQSGSITVTVTDPGAFQVAVSTDQFNEPAPSAYRNYSNPSVVFTGLQRGTYFVYAKSASVACPTRSAPVNIFGVYAITFNVEPSCVGNSFSITLTQVTGETNGPPLEIHVTRKLSSDPPEIIYKQFPASGEIYLDNSQHLFLRTPGDYTIRIFQFQNEVACSLSSGLTDLTVPMPLAASVRSVKESYPDIASGELNVAGFSGGINPYTIRIDLDSASSLALPSFTTNYEIVGLNNDQQFEKVYRNIPAGRYVVDVEDSQGCVIQFFARVPLDVDLFVPNVFTPNGDGSNDVFYIRNLPPAPDNELIISNRWGKEIFSSTNYQNNWDGEGVEDGIYFYRLLLEDGGVVTGWLEIIRGQKP